ncbi:hypothetical protein CFP75_39740 [Amycolatopsis alba DSM 44262]|uniref:Uncharacterized protein n=1 Tax=Amycolatopsis alba DSM 44262 TaxID=1125972 RepID=A0A229R978_AMYAL|nr:hypothetical protein CFP75_39740 [Amycolatopsis alba DSM 44262]
MIVDGVTPADALRKAAAWLDHPDQTDIDLWHAGFLRTREPCSDHVDEPCDDDCPSLTRASFSVYYQRDPGEDA